MGKAFVEVLDNLLLDGFDPGPLPLRAHPGFGYRTQPLMFDLGATLEPRPVAVRPTFDIPVPRLPRRRWLSARQREAFDTFVALGARLGEDFTPDDLRAQYRALALRYHPDRHPGTSGREAAHLTTCFSQLTNAHQRLQSVSAAS